MYIQKRQKLIGKHACSPTFLTPLFTIAKTWKQPNCPLTDEWIKMWNIQWNINVKKNEIMPSAATWMYLEIIILSEVSRRKTSII